jgi:Fungal N-terminal domain of STAND proteins
MADPLSVSSAVVGLVVPALHGARLLLEDIHQIRGAPKAIVNLKEELRLFELALQSLQAVEQSEWESLGGTIADQAKLALATCSDTCKLFRDDLRSWTKHSDEETLSWRDRVNVGFFKKHRVHALADQLSNCYKAINLVVSMATLYVLFALDRF